MRFSAFIIACATILQLDAEVRFTRAEWLPDIGLSMPLPEGAVADPLEMPKADAYLVTDNGKTRLEDRFDTFDLWTALTVRGRWRDVAGNEFRIARLVAELPDDPSGVTRTRGDFRKRLKPLDVKNAAHRDEAVYALTSVELGRPERARRNGRRNFLELLRYPCTNENVFVYAFRPRTPETREKPDWYVVSLVGAPGEDVEALKETFEESFLEEVELPAFRRRASLPPAPVSPDAGETELLREDYRRSVVNYADWHFTSSGDLMIADNLDAWSRAPFIATLTNELPRLRREYADALPSAQDDSFHPAAIRVFRSREEYLAYVGVDAKWTGALWSPLRRELVMYLSGNGVESLLRTVWHEAFHQYLSYAGSMLSAAPWLNEGHAELFEHAHFDAEGDLVYERPYEQGSFIHDNAAALAELLPTLLLLDYEDFYAGDHAAREKKYYLAWSVAYFLQVGAPEVRFRPFEKLRADYMSALVSTRDGRRATRAVLSGDALKKFVAEWLAFWRKE